MADPDQDAIPAAAAPPVAGDKPAPVDTRAIPVGVDRWHSAGKLVIGALALVGVVAMILAGAGGLGRLQTFDASETNPAGMLEWRWAQADHEHIALAVAACSHIVDLTLAPVIVHQLRLDTGPDGQTLPWARRTTRAAVASVASVAPGSQPDFHLSNFQRTAIFLSDTIARARFENASNASTNSGHMYTFQFLIVTIGAITTILISIKSISNADQDRANSRLFFWIGIAAIVFSSVGTAASALNSFYSPREAYLKNASSLYSLRQLHQDLASQVTGILEGSGVKDCGQFDPIDRTNGIAEQVDEWITKLDKVINGTVSAGASPAASTNGTSPGTTSQ
jgi:hypothetical protein